MRSCRASRVIDSASPDRDQQIAAVDSVLKEIGADAVPQILVWNKIDLTAAAPGIDRDDYGRLRRVRVSACTGAGMDLLRQALAEAARERVQGLAVEADAA
mgnify:CR=1 FL=1